MPIWRMGKLREALTINSELYKKLTMRYLTSRGYYLKASSDVEATFADCVLTKRGDTRDYWLEVKATTVSLGEADFLSQLGKYLAAYVSRTPRNRFKMMLVCYKLVNADLFSQIFDRLDAITIDALTKRVIESTDAELEPTILRARPVDIRQFFEDAIIIEADFRDLQVAEEKVAPKPPVRPQLSEAEYAAQILNSFGDVEPHKRFRSDLAQPLPTGIAQVNLRSKNAISDSNVDIRRETQYNISQLSTSGWKNIFFQQSFGGPFVQIYRHRLRHGNRLRSIRQRPKQCQIGDDTRQ